MSDVVMDYPTAWAWARATKMEEHDPRCSYRSTAGRLLCDCHVINEEYKRREDALRAPHSEIVEP